ncbi:uncharacterized protein LY79DRAFT_347237 [Colletotrichum navitas]|uniref:Uncharacterized protein n=1 Tax=Colletotrichum navitas TaxID=681940 RepID=A0AAD8PS26_9PEZI|nr:uncharacterized protein LY79DRAFT_347237 [Colletotrichum navitas]KAK1579207.1 hypothetical protein LY79DRAFT_347237 [Colletotrichum navitas]
MSGSYGGMTDVPAIMALLIFLSFYLSLSLSLSFSLSLCLSLCLREFLVSSLPPAGSTATKRSRYPGHSLGKFHHPPASRTEVPFPTSSTAKPSQIRALPCWHPIPTIGARLSPVLSSWTWLPVQTELSP